jgi:hypothetical protein
LIYVLNIEVPAGLIVIQYIFLQNRYESEQKKTNHSSQLVLAEADSAATGTVMEDVTTGLAEINKLTSAGEFEASVLVENAGFVASAVSAAPAAVTLNAAAKAFLAAEFAFEAAVKAALTVLSAAVPSEIFSLDLAEACL